MSNDARLAAARAALSAAEAVAGGTGSVPGTGSLTVDPEYAQAKRIVLSKLAAAPRSRAQLTDTLLAKDISPETADAVLDRMEDVGLVDDVAFAEMTVRYLQNSRGLARRSVLDELAKRGVSDEIALDAVEHIDDDRDRDSARNLVAKRMRSVAGLEPDVQRRRLAGYLARRGYPSGIAFPVIEEALADQQQYRRD